MTRIAKSGLLAAGCEQQQQSGSKRDSLLDVAGKRKEVLVARSVVDELKRRVLQFRGESKDKHEKEKEEKMEEKARAAAWAWYQRGKGGKESVSSSSSSGGGALSTLTVRPGGPPGAHKISRFKTEALKSSGGHSGRVEPSRTWEFSPTQTSSLFDSYEIDSVSKRIDDAFHEHDQPETVLTAPLHQPPQVSSTPKIARSSSLRMQFPRSICRSISDVVTHEEMALGVDIRKCECQRNKPSRSGGWSFRRFSKAIQVLMHLPECEYHPQQQHVERRQARELHEHHHHHHQHAHAHHHHIHYQVKLNDGIHYGKSITTFPAISDLSAESPKEDQIKFSRRSPKLSPKVSPKFSSQ